MSIPSNERSPSKIWYVGHLFFWIITGLICYIIWKDENKQMAKKHLIHSIWITFLWFIPYFLVIIVLNQSSSSLSDIDFCERTGDPRFCD